MRPPWHLWVIGMLALLWNAGSAYDYILIKTRNAEYLANMTPLHIAYLDAFPLWVGMAWAVGVWGAVVGAFLVLLQSRFASTAFAVSLVGIFANLFYGLTLSKISMLDIAGPFALTFSMVIILIALGLWLYARRMTRTGVLK